MPARIKKVDGFRVTHGRKVSAKRTTRPKAESQRRLLEGIRHGWRPTGQPALTKKKRSAREKYAHFLKGRTA